MALSMVVIASMIGVAGLGVPVLRSISNQYLALGLMNGLAIVALAIIFDRVSQRFGSACSGIARASIMAETKISIENLYKIFGPRPQSVLAAVQQGMSKQELLEEHDHVLGLKDINIEVSAREISVIMGLSGSGKSTLIRHINRLIEPTSGRIMVNGRDVLAMTREELIEVRRHSISMVFQRFGLHVHKTVAENAAYGLAIQGMPIGEAKQQSRKWLDRVGLSGFENHYPSQLSGGMQQRVGLARALATDADILLMDEPFSALDPLIRTDMQQVLLGLQEELHKTIVFITHDLDEALRLGDSIAILRDGALIQQGNPQDIILHPADDYIFDFVKDINRGRVIEAPIGDDAGRRHRRPERGAQPRPRRGAAGGERRRGRPGQGRGRRRQGGRHHKPEADHRRHGPPGRGKRAGSEIPLGPGRDRRRRPVSRQRTPPAARPPG